MNVTIKAYSHFLKVTDFDDTVKQILYRFIDRYLAQYEIIQDHMGRVSREMKCVFAARTADCSEFRFHINQMQTLVDWLRGYGIPVRSEDIDRVALPEPVKAEFVVKPGWEPNEGQVKALDYIFIDNPLTKMIPLQAGAGKTAATFFAMAQAGLRTTLIIKSSLLNQWIDAYKKQLEYRNGDILAIQGRKDLLSLIHLAQADELNVKFIAISNVTLQRYITDWEKSSGEDPATPVSPEELFLLLRQGIQVQDEWHLYFHLNFKIDLYTHVLHAIKLSATVHPDDAFMSRMYEIAAPAMQRFSGIEYNRYVHVVGYAYAIDDLRKIRTTARGRRSYSHKEFEKSLLRNKRQLGRYKEMVKFLVQDDFIKVQSENPGLKMVLYADLVDMCSEFQEYLQGHYPGLKVMRKVSGDPESVLEDADIICTTLGSMGVGNDVADLYYALLTTAISARSANEQAKGRLRVLKRYPHLKPRFAYLYCTSIPKQIEYHRKKMEDFKGKCLTHLDMMLPHRV